MPVTVFGRDGFVDHHVHFLSTAASLLSVDVSAAASLAHLAAAVRQAGRGRPAGTWMRVWGYDEANLAERRHPTRADLDRAWPDGPVVLHHRTGHAAVLNSPALEEVGATCHPDGVLIDRHDLLGRVPRLDGPALREAARRVSRDWARLGVKAFVDATVTNGPAELELLASWCRDGVLIQQVTAMVDGASLSSLPGYGGRVGPVEVGPVKILPGVGPGRVGLHQAVAAAHRHGFPVAVHVTEIDVLEDTLQAFAASPPPPGTSDRIEHNALCLPEQVPRIAASGATVVVNPSFLIHRRVKYERELQPLERGWLIRIRSLIEAGITVRAGSDSPVTPCRPEEMMAAATAHPFSPEESIGASAAAALLSP